MTQRAARPVLSLQNVTQAGRPVSSGPPGLDLELLRGEVAFVRVDDQSDATSLVDLCLGLADPAAGMACFLDVDWQARTPMQRLRRRRRIGAVVQADIWPSHMTVFESVLVARSYHFDQPHAELIADATRLARLFGLPGLPAGRPESTARQALLRAACVRGFLGSPDLVVVQDRMLEQAHDLALPMAQAISAACDRGGSVLWITESVAPQAARFVHVDLVFRLDEHGLIPIRGSR